MLKHETSRYSFSDVCFKIRFSKAIPLFVVFVPVMGLRGGASPEKVGWKRDQINGQKVYVTIFMSFLLRNEYRPEKSGVDNPSPPRGAALDGTALPLWPARMNFWCR